MTWLHKLYPCIKSDQNVSSSKCYNQFLPDQMMHVLCPSQISFTKLPFPIRKSPHPIYPCYNHTQALSHVLSTHLSVPYSTPIPLCHYSTATNISQSNFVLCCPYLIYPISPYNNPIPPHLISTAHYNQYQPINFVVSCTYLIYAMSP